MCDCLTFSSLTEELESNFLAPYTKFGERRQLIEAENS